ncbi:hypothetical protein BOX15_Mlig013413g3 [Macrostomum lignano]|uniref:MI domain-containing protein n=1 Tax=Macrostomum lignano TaxID=282301 RepID=A0A267HB46_9PLAT|nr:hypothetical protein BOX15_Mlig013413g3 [Macrostomum lignano]
MNNRHQQDYQQPPYIQGPYQTEFQEGNRAHLAQNYRYSQGQPQSQVIYGQNPNAAYQQQGASSLQPGWPAGNMPGQFPSSSMQQQYMAPYVQQPVQPMMPMQHPQVPPGYPPMQPWNAMAMNPGSNPQTYGIPAMQQQPPPPHHQQPNPAYPQQFVPGAYASGTRPQTGQLHSRAQFHPSGPAPAPHQPFMQHGGPGPEQHQPAPQQQQQAGQQQQEAAAPIRERKRLAIVNPDTKEEVHVEKPATSTSAAGSAAAGIHQPSPPPQLSGPAHRPSRGLPIEKPPADGQTVQKDLLKLRATAKPATAAAQQPTSTTPAAPPATVEPHPAAPSDAAEAKASAAAPALAAQPESISVDPLPPPAKPPTPSPSPEVSEAAPMPAPDAEAKKEGATAPALKSESSAAESPAADSPVPTALAQKSPVASPPVNGDATDGSRQSPAVAPSSRKASVDAGRGSAGPERRTQQPPPLIQPPASGKYEFKPEPGESDKTTLEKKLKYDRGFLLSLQFTDLSNQRPDELPGDIPELLPRSDSQQQPPRAVRGFDFTPSFVVQPNYVAKDKGKSIYGSHRGSGGRGGGGGGPPKPAPKPQLVIEVRKDKVDLHKSDSAYVPGFLQKKPDDQEQLKKVEIERNIRSILNKIAPQNFESCFSQLTTTCDIGSIQGLNACVDIIFDKATREKSYSSVFAEICKRLAFLKVNFPEQSQENKQFIGFRSLLLKKCQEMFETPLKEQMEQKGAQWQEKIDAEEKEDKKKALEEERDEQMKKAKDQYYGNIRFIGELFMKDILTANIIHQCIVSQLKSDHSSKSMFTESLECLCELLKTVGKKLESENNAKARIDQYFERIKKLINSKEIESKVRFRLQDIVEMRQRNWERREMEIRLHERPMTKEELEQKARQDESRKQQLAGMQQQQTRGGRQGGFSRPPAGPTPAANSEWTPVTTTRKAQKMDARKMVIGSSQEQGQSQTRLGPSRPSFVAKARPSGKDDGGRGTPRLGSQKNSRESSASRGTSREASPHLDPQQLQQPAVAALAASGKMPRSQSSQELPARAVESPRSVEPPPIPRDVLERKSKNIMMEWLGSLCSLEDTKSNFIEISRHPEISAFVEVNAEHLLNENSKELRERGGQLLFELLHSELLSSKDLIEGFSPIMEMADDFLSDFPLLSSYLGEIFSSFVQKAASYLSCVQQLVLRIPADLRDSSRRPLRGEVVSRALHLASGRLGHDRVGAAFREAGMAWHSLLELPQADAADFVAANKLEFTLHETMLSPSPIALDVVGERIEQKIGNADGDASAKDLLSEELIALIEKEVDKKQMESREFIRVLVRSVCRGCTQSKKLNKPLFLLVKPVLMRHIETHEQQQQWVLSATCDTIKSAGLSLELINDLFFAYLDNAIICEDSFKQWYQEAGKELQDATQVFINTLESTHSPSTDS